MIAPRTVFVAGATGTSGAAYVAALVAAGHHVRGSARGEAVGLLAAGAVGVRLDLRDTDATAAAIVGADAVVISLTGRGPDAVADEARVTRSVFDACARAGIPHVIYSSVAQANEAVDVPHFHVKARLEDHLMRTAPGRVTVLRPGTFADAFVAPWLAQGIMAGQLTSPISRTAGLSYVGVDDLAAVAVAALSEPRLDGVVDVGGEPVTFDELLLVLSRLASREVVYQQVPLDVARAQFGDDMAAMVRRFNAHGLRTRPEPLHALGLRPRPLGQWLQDNWNRTEAH